MGIPSAWEMYDRWNSALAEEFFSGRYGGRPVYIDLEEDVLERVAHAAGQSPKDPAAGLVEATRPTLHVLARRAIFGDHRRRLALWKLNGREGPPPVLATLALLSLVAEQMAGDDVFHSSNYYGRFLHVLGYDAADERLRSKVVRSFAEESHALWAGLNDWLEEDIATRGQPTARAFDYRIHVGVPMSQALVREADRDALEDLFVDYRLAAGQRLSHSDMLRLLREWLPQSPLSATLKRLCQHNEALERVADVACIELAAWGGASGARATAGRQRLAFVASLRRHPRPRLSLGLRVRVGTREARELRLREDAGDAAKAALADGRGRLRLGPADGSGWSDVENSDEVVMDHALVATLALESAELSVRRIPRRLVVLERDEERRRHVEVDRARLGAQYMLLATETLAPLLDRALDEAARPGWTAHEAGRVLGLPGGWRLYSGVEMVGITTSKQLDLAALVPVGWTQLSLTGGLALPGRSSWLTSAPPELSASSLAGQPVTAVLTEEVGDEQERGPEGPPEADAPAEGEHGSLRLELGEVDPAAIFDLGELELSEGAYRATLLPLEGQGAALSSVALRLRSADGCGPVSEPLAHDLGRSALAALGAESGGAGIRGARLPDAPTRRLSAPDGLPSALEDWERADEERAEEVSEPLPPVIVSLPTCMESGAHRFQLPPATRSKSRETIHAVCLYCGIERFFPARPHRRGPAPARGLRGAGLAHAAALPRLPARPAEREAVEFDQLLEALSTVGSGPWRGFERLVHQMDDSPWAAVEAARTLSALGHVDLELSGRDLRPLRWAIAPPMLVSARDGAFLAGWRSELLLGALGRDAVALGGRVVWQPTAAAPTVVRVTGLEDDRLRQLVERVSDTLGHELGLSRATATSLVERLPPLHSVRSALSEAPAPLGLDLERFNPARGRWLRASGPHDPGAYRTTRPPRGQWHFDGRDWRAVDSRLGKWLAAMGREALMAYDRESRILACHLGAQLPGLYERAAVLSSGEAPQMTESGHVAYRGVEPSVARALASALSVALPEVIAHARTA